MLSSGEFAVTTKPPFAGAHSVIYEFLAAVLSSVPGCRAPPDKHAGRPELIDLRVAGVSVYAAHAHAHVRLSLGETRTAKTQRHPLLILQSHPAISGVKNQIEFVRNGKYPRYRFKSGMGYFKIGVIANTESNYYIEMPLRSKAYPPTKQKSRTSSLYGHSEIQRKPDNRRPLSQFRGQDPRLQYLFVRLQMHTHECRTPTSHGRPRYVARI